MTWPIYSSPRLWVNCICKYCKAAALQFLCGQIQINGITGHVCVSLFAAAQSTVNHVH